MGVSKEIPVETAVVVGSEENISREVIQKDVKKRWQSYIWDTFDKSPEERHFMFKLDFALLTMASLGNSPSLESISQVVYADYN